jgi:peptidoglycan/xylan/chitin deacetylase (PgdA/CDA1 family)
MWRSGHLLINHTQQHEHPLQQNFATLLNEVQLCDQEIGRALGVTNYRSRFFRAPFGIVTPSVRRVIRRLRMKQVLLSHYGWDTRVGPHNYRPVVDKLLKNAERHHGGLFVFHDGSLCPARQQTGDWAESSENRSWVPDAANDVIQHLTDSGLRFVLPCDGIDMPSGESIAA